MTKLDQNPIDKVINMWDDLEQKNILKNELIGAEPFYDKVGKLCAWRCEVCHRLWSVKQQRACTCL